MITPGMRVAVVGFGRSGQAIARYLSQCGAHVLVSDIRNLDHVSGSEKALLLECSAEYEGDGHTRRFLRQAEIIIVSPGVALDHPALLGVIDAGIPVIGELALAAGHFEAPVVAITGTNGKTTVTELIGALLAATGKKVFLGGNIGTPVGDYLIDPGGYDAIVLEVSSFQLDLCGNFTPDVGVLLNLTPDHLDRHGSMERYACAKMKIFGGGQGIKLAVINGDDPLIRGYQHLSGCHSFLRFGYNGEYAASIKDCQITISRAGDVSVYDLSGSSLATVSGCLNSAASLLAVQSFDISREVTLQTLHSFKTGDHRLQVVDVIDRVVYINDSKATNTGAVNNGLEQAGEKVILIAGGQDKGDDYRLLRESVGKHVKTLVLLGEASRSLSDALGDLVPVQYTKDMDDAVGYAASVAQPGDTVLLSPACASFDMFENYVHRGKCFAEAVENLRQGIFVQVHS